MPRIPHAWPVAALVTLWAILISAGCKDGTYRADPFVEEDPDALYVPIEPPLTTDSPAAGIRGVARPSTLPEDFRRRVSAVDPTLAQFSGSAEAYDAVIIAGLATETARTDAPARIAQEIVTVTDGSELCFSFHECRLEIDAGGETDYDGPSGAVTLLPSGDPAVVSMDVIEMMPDGSRRIDDTVTVVLDDPVGRAPFIDPQLGFRGDGILRIGTLLPVNGPEGDVARAALAGVKVAVDEMNADVGVLGDPVELVADESGDGSPAAIEEAVRRLVEAEVDVVIGGTEASIDRAAIGAVTSSGLVLFSPTDGDRAVATIPDNGRFFRMSNHEAAEGPALARLIANEGYSRVAIVVGDDEDSLDLKDDLTIGLTDASVEVVSTVRLTPASEAAFVATGIVNAAPDAVVLLGSPASAAPILEELTRIGSGPSSLPTFASGTVMTPELVALLDS